MLNDQSEKRATDIPTRMTIFDNNRLLQDRIYECTINSILTFETINAHLLGSAPSASEAPISENDVSGIANKDNVRLSEILARVEKLYSGLCEMQEAIVN